MGRSILARYDAAASLERRLEQLDPAALPGGAALSPIHLRTVEVLGELLSLADGASDEHTPQILRTMLSVVRRSRPMLLDLIGKVPEDAIMITMRKLRDDIQSVLDAGSSAAALAQLEGGHGDAGPAGGAAGSAG